MLGRSSQRSLINLGIKITKSSFSLHIVGSRRLMASANFKQSDYSKWSNERLVERVTALESQLKDQTEKLARTDPTAKPEL